MATEGTLVFMRSFGCKQNLLFRPDSSANVTQGCAEKLQERLLRNTWGHRHHYTRATCTMDWLELEDKRDKKRYTEEVAKESSSVLTFAFDSRENNVFTRVQHKRMLCNTPEKRHLHRR
ncbi:uncharacterized protein LOC118409100 isoform X4 [Branchiostoma floridae]|uniref:Uncharacterized protein LOC118409100 isoform X4 n=1 Tax=Branchiostoma floridae TaxID=7739 RepID=A0A9J7HW82_BRAFL|nr:uncharacterized protein LOC118409100 isoform X4 [Branchiostoma floridae]